MISGILYIAGTVKKMQEEVSLLIKEK